MGDMISIWLQFGACLGLVAVAGPQLCRSGDVIADKTGVSASWIGLVLLAVVTSLPELVTGASAITLTHSVDVAIGDVLGSCVFNLSLLAVLDFVQRGESVYRRAGTGHVLSAGIGVVLIGFVGMNILLRDKGLAFSLWQVGGYAPIIVLLYVVGMRATFFYERERLAESVEATTSRYPELTLRDAVLRYAGAAVVVVAAGVWLPFIAADLAQAMGWRSSFVGTMFVALVTSMPELFVTLAAVRLGALDMAFANVLGSNLFNMVVLVVDDVLFRKGPILSYAAPELAVSAFSAVIMSGIVITGLVYRPRNRVFGTVGWVSLALFSMYLFNTYAAFLHG